MLAHRIAVSGKAVTLRFAIDFVECFGSPRRDGDHRSQREGVNLRARAARKTAATADCDGV